MASRMKPVLISSVAIGFVIFSIVCVTGWYSAVEESRQLREMNRNLVAQISAGQRAISVSENAVETHHNVPEEAVQDQDGQLVLPPGLGQEFPELLLPMTPDRALDFQQRQFKAPITLPGQTGEW